MHMQHTLGWAHRQLVSTGRERRSAFLLPSRPNARVPLLGAQDIEFIDIIEYDPRQMQASPYRMRIQTKLPSAGDRVRPSMADVVFARPCILLQAVCQGFHSYGNQACVNASACSCLCLKLYAPWS